MHEIHPKSQPVVSVDHYWRDDLGIRAVVWSRFILANYLVDLPKCVTCALFNLLRLT